MAKKYSTDKTPDNDALYKILDDVLTQANSGFYDLRSLAVASAALMTKHGADEDDLSIATNLMYQLQERASALAEIMDIVHVMRQAQGGAAAITAERLKKKEPQAA